jgi:hypothetical protein
MKQICIRWGDLGSPTQSVAYHCGAHRVDVTPGDIKLAKGNRTHCDPAPYLLTGVELPTNPKPLS